MQYTFAFRILEYLLAWKIDIYKYYGMKIEIIYRRLKLKNAQKFYVQL